jgi:hypothetical protein
MLMTFYHHRLRRDTGAGVEERREWDEETGKTSGINEEE